MGIFRNPQIKRDLAVWSVAMLVIVAISAVIELKFAAFAAVICAALFILHFVSSYMRYREISNLSLEIDKILHGSRDIDLRRYSEGELAVLHNEIYKMTLRLHEQADALLSDKQYLADSLADISHQIRTPLTSLNLITVVMAEEELSDAQRLNLAKQMKALLSRIDWLISSLLKISRLDAGTVRFDNCKVMARDLIKKAYDSVSIPMELKNQQLIVKCKGDESFTGDFSWSCEAMCNILKNCMEHTPSGGSITIESHETAIYTQFVISDTGCGIDKEDLPHLFERFYKGRNSSDNSVGIGLALARMIIVQQNGSIKAENKKDGGAQFTIRFYKCTV